MTHHLIVVSYNSATLLSRCLEPFRSGSGAIVVDNASEDGSADMVDTQFPGVRLIRNERNLGFAGAANVGIEAAESDVVVLLNPDVLVAPEAVDALVQALESDPRTAIVGGKLVYPDGKTIQHAGGTISYPLALADHYGYGEVDNGNYDRQREVDYVTGAFLAIRRSALDSTGIFDEGFFPAYFEEADLCLRIRQAGYTVLYVPEARAIHHESVTTGRRTRQYFHLYHRNRLRFVLKHWTDEQLAQDFLPAEIDRMRGLSREEVDALVEAYVDNLSVLQGRATFFTNPPMVAPISATPARLRLLRRLSERTMTRCEVDPGTRRMAGGEVVRAVRGTEERRPMSELMSETSGTPAPTPLSVDSLATSTSVATSTPDPALSRLRALQRIIEPGFSSALPAVGPVLVRLRRAWNWMSTKWYVRPIVQQQNAFNETIADAIFYLHGLHATARDQLAAVERKLETWEGAAVEAERASVGLTRDLARLEVRLQRIEARLESIERILGAVADSDSTHVGP